MDSNMYLDFIKDSKSIIEKNIDGKENNNSKSYIPILSCTQCNDTEYLSSVLRKSLENLDENLIKFDGKYSSKNGLKIYWADDYNDVLSGLHTIVSKKNIKTVYYQNDYLYDEVGLNDFIRKEKLTYSDNADVQFIKVEKLVADTGSILIFDKDMLVSGRLDNKSINIFLVGIEQVISTIADAEIYSKVMLSACENVYDSSIFYHPVLKGKNYLFLIDNGRSTMLSMKKQREALICLHCGRCKNVCSVYNVVGNKPYNNVFAGPIANVILPFFETIESYKHVSYACLMCGSCEKVCPLSIPIRDMVIENRKYFRENKCVDSSDNSRYMAYKKMVTNRNKMNKSKFLRSRTLKKYLSKTFRKKRKMPPLEVSSFNKQYLQKIENNGK